MNKQVKELLKGLAMVRCNQTGNTNKYWCYGLGLVCMTSTTHSVKWCMLRYLHLVFNNFLLKSKWQRIHDYSLRLNVAHNIVDMQMVAYIHKIFIMKIREFNKSKQLMFKNFRLHSSNIYINNKQVKSMHCNIILCIIISRSY